MEIDRDVLLLALKVLKDIEWEGNDKSSRCITCGAHCSVSHDATCELTRAAWGLAHFLYEGNQVAKLKL